MSDPPRSICCPASSFFQLTASPPIEAPRDSDNGAIAKAISTEVYTVIRLKAFDLVAWDIGALEAQSSAGISRSFVYLDPSLAVVMAGVLSVMNV